MGTLYICGTPIGNLEDISPRALRALRGADCIAAEDTRHTLKLLNYYEIKTPLTSYHEHNKREKGPDLVRQLKEGRNIALVTDAGMPCISDPGADLVRLCIEGQIPVEPIPGPSALIAALAVSGMDSRRFVFEGFLPRDRKGRGRILAELQSEPRTIILYEAPHHLKGTLADLAGALGDRPAVLARELTKVHEEIIRGGLCSLVEKFDSMEPVGEYVVIIDAKEFESNETCDMSMEEHVKLYMDGGLSEMDAMKRVARDRGIGKREVYGVVKKGSF